MFRQFLTNFSKFFTKMISFLTKTNKRDNKIVSVHLITKSKLKRKKNWKKPLHFHVIFGRISAEISAEFSVNLAEISVSAETDFGRFGRSLHVSD